MSQLEWKVDEFCALSHGYDYPDDGGATVLKSILNDHALVIGDRPNQYPGIYMNFERLGRTLKLHNCLIYFVFSKALLKSPAWHTSCAGCGIIDHTSYCPATFDQCKVIPDEVVFHHNVSLDYLEYIIVPEEYIDEVSILVGGKWPVYAGDHTFTHHCTKLSDQPSHYEDVPFSLAYLVDDEYTEFNEHTLKCTMLNMGYSTSNADVVITGFGVELTAKALQLKSRDRAHYPVVVPCPY